MTDNVTGYWDKLATFTTFQLHLVVLHLIKDKIFDIIHFLWLLLFNYYL